MTMEKQPWMKINVSPIKNGDFPASHDSFLEGTLLPIIIEVKNGFLQ